MIIETYVLHARNYHVNLSNKTSVNWAGPMNQGWEPGLSLEYCMVEKENRILHVSF